MRLFFALWPDAGERAALAAATRAALHATRGRAIPRENLHVTLAFLGSVPEDRVAGLRAVALSVRIAPFVLVLERLVHFARARVLAAMPAGEPAALLALTAQLRERLGAAGFPTDPRPFRAHLTLAREVAQPLEDQHMTAVALRCASFALVESRTERTGALYSVIDAWPLDDAKNT